MIVGVWAGTFDFFTEFAVAPSIEQFVRTVVS